jgi:hypothetical protein
MEVVGERHYYKITVSFFDDKYERVAENVIVDDSGAVVLRHNGPNSKCRAYYDAGFIHTGDDEPCPVALKGTHAMWLRSRLPSIWVNYLVTIVKLDGYVCVDLKKKTDSAADNV